MIVCTLHDKAAGVYNQPFVVDSWDMACRSVGATLDKNPELAERAEHIFLESVGYWSASEGFTAAGSRSIIDGRYCLNLWRSTFDPECEVPGEDESE